MTVTSGLNLGLPAAPLADDPNLNGELQIIYNALHLLQQVLNDAGIPSGGVSPSPAIADVPHGGTGVATITGMLYGNGVANITGVASAVVGNVLKVTGANTYAFSAPGYGDVTGPAGAVAGNVAVFSGATGKVIADGGTLGSAAFTSSAAYDVAGAAAAVTPTTLGLVIGTNVQAYDADLTTWAGITPGANVGTFLVTPSSANLRATLTDETGTGAAVFATVPSFTTRLGVGAVDPSALDGSGICFPATQDPSTNANTLDDYEEGVSSAVTITCGAGSATVHASYNLFKYTKIGRQVNFTGRIAVTVVTAASGSLVLNNLPFTNGSDISNWSAVTVQGYALTGGAGATPLIGVIAPSSTTITITRLVAGVDTNDVAGFLVTNQSEFRICGTYFIN